MLHHIYIDLTFPSLEHMLPLQQLAQAQLQWAITVNPGQLNEQKGTILSEECYHDINPSLPCITTFEAHTP